MSSLFLAVIRPVDWLLPGVRPRVRPRSVPLVLSVWNVRTLVHTIMSITRSLEWRAAPAIGFTWNESCRLPRFRDCVSGAAVMLAVVASLVVARD
jgi:hypothetical protein